MARKSTSKKVVVSVVVASMVVIVASSIGLLSVWGQRDPAVYADRATKACRAGEMIEAIRAYSQAYRQTLDPRWIVESGLVARSFGDAARALSLFDKAVAAAPNVLAAHRGRLELRLELIRLDPSAEGYANLRKDAEALLGVADRDPLGLLAKSIALEGLVQEDPTYAEQSLHAIQQAHELAPKDVEIADALAKRYEQTDPEEPGSPGKGKQTVGRAEQIYMALVDAVPKQTEAWLRYGEFLLRRLKARREQAAARGIALGASDAKRSLQEIQRLLDTATELDPKNGEIALAWGEYWSLSGQPDKAVEKLADALKSVPNDLRLHVELARRLLEAGQVERARNVLQQGLKQPFDPESYLGMLNRPLRHRLWCMLGQSYLQGLDPDSKDAAAMVAEADKARRQADQELSPDHWMGRMLLGQIRRAQGRGLAAVARYREADRMLDWSQSARDKMTVKLELGKVQTELAQYGAAHESLSAVLQHRPNDPVALAMKAWLDLKIGESGKAVVGARLALQGLRRRGETGSPSTSSGARPARADLLRQCLRVWWAASTVEEQPADAARAQQDLSPLTADDHLFVAEACWLYGSLFKGSKKLIQAAEAAYLTGIQADPTRVDAIRRLVTAYSAQNRADEARQVVEKANQALEHPPAGAGAAAVETARARLTALLAELDPKLSADERNKRVVAALSGVADPVRRAELLADHYLSSGQPEQAVKQLSAASKKRPDDVHLLERLFAAALQAEDWSTARALETRAAKLDADGTGGRLYEGRLELAMGLQLRSDASEKQRKDKAAAQKEEDAVARFGTAVDALRAGVEEASGMPMARVWLGQALDAYGQAQEAKDAYQAALLLNPLNAEAHRELARLGKATPSDDVDADKHLTAAVELSTKGLDGLPTNAWLRDQAQAIYERKHPAESIQRREARRKAEPNDSDNVFRLGLLYGHVGQKDKAEQRLTEALKMAPKDIELHERVARLYLLDKRHEEGAKLLTDLAARLQGSERAEALLAKARLLQTAMLTRKAAGAASGELGTLRDRTDEAFEAAYKLDATPEICRSAANFCLITQRQDKAVEWLRRALRIRQHKLDERPIRHTLITTLLSMSPLPEGVEREIEEYDARFQGYEEVSLFWGMLQVARGKVDEGVAQYTRYIDRLLRAKGSAHIKPGQLGQAYYLRGDLHMRLATARPEQRAEYLRRAVDDFTRAKTYSASGPPRPRYAISLAKALWRAGKTEVALRELRAAAREHANDSTVVRALVSMLGQNRKYRGEQEALIRQQVQLRPKEWIWPYLLGRVLEGRGAVHNAEQAYRKAAELSDYGAHGDGEEAVVALVKVMAARAAFRDIIELIEGHTKPAQRDCVLLTYYGASLGGTNRLDEALAAWSAACSSAIKTGQLITVSEGMKAILGKERALQAARDMVKKDPRNVHRVMLLTVMLDQAELYDEALELLDRSRPLATQPADKAELLTYAGTLRMLRNRANEAVDLFKQALDIDKDNEVALNNLAYALADDLNQPKEALTYARRAAELKPDSFGVLDTLGWCLSQAGEHQAGMDLLGEAFEKRPTPLIAYHLAETQRRLKDLKAARETAEQGLKLAEQTKNKKYQAKLQKLLDQIKADT